MAAVVLISGAGALGVAMIGAVTGDVEIGEANAEPAVEAHRKEAIEGDIRRLEQVHSTTVVAVENSDRHHQRRSMISTS